eukprot:8763386-Pyramimonas_sp.AAC.1
MKTPIQKLTQAARAASKDLQTLVAAKKRKCEQGQADAAAVGERKLLESSKKARRGGKEPYVFDQG